MVNYFFGNSIFRPVSDYFVPDLLFVLLDQYSLYYTFWTFSPKNRNFSFYKPFTQAFPTIKLRKFNNFKKCSGHTCTLLEVTAELICPTKWWQAQASFGIPFFEWLEKSLNCLVLLTRLFLADPMADFSTKSGGKFATLDAYQIGRRPCLCLLKLIFSYQL